MVRADSRLGRLVLALAALPPDAGTAPPDVGTARPGRRGARLMAALGTRPLPVRVRVRMRGSERRPPAPGWTGWAPGFAAACILGVMGLTVGLVQGAGVLPSPWREIGPGGAGTPRTETWQPVGTRVSPFSGPVSALAFSPDGLTLVAASDVALDAWRLSPSGQLLAQSMIGTGPVSALDFTTDGHTFVAAQASGLTAWDVEAGKRLWSVSLGQSVEAVSGGRSSVRWAAFGSGDTVQVQEGPLPPVGETASGGTIRLPHAPRAAQFTPDGDTLAVADADWTVRLWDVTDPTHPKNRGRPFTVGTEGATALAFTPDGTLLAAVGRDRRVRLWDVTDPSKPGYVGRPITESDEAVTTLAFSSHGGLLAMAGPEGAANLWRRGH
ncbi:WD40 repeat domain-containing protein [Streptomyces lutosisoli]|uniref:WD40 repeat domain-containing protein n=1 Tax=Streptomyces lutosisoli TaxID=2665721 RepID=A0ABW2V976_9ACTN